MLIDIQKWIKRKFKVKAKTAYRIVYYLYGIITFIPILAISYMFDTIPFTLVAFVVTSSIRRYSYGLHMTNGKCIYLTIILLISLGMLSKNIPLVYSFFIALWCVRDIYIKSPLKLTIKGKDEKWHRDRIMLILAICLFASVIGLYFNLIWYTNCILMSIIMVDLTLFINRDELDL